jgi:hypothetical protein
MEIMNRKNHENNTFNGNLKNKTQNNSGNVHITNWDDLTELERVKYQLEALKECKKTENDYLTMCNDFQATYSQLEQSKEAVRYQLIQHQTMLQESCRKVQDQIAQTDYWQKKLINERKITKKLEFNNKRNIQKNKDLRKKFKQLEKNTYYRLKKSETPIEYYESQGWDSWGPVAYIPTYGWATNPENSMCDSDSEDVKTVEEWVKYMKKNVDNTDHEEYDCGYKEMIECCEEWLCNIAMAE